MTSPLRRKQPTTAPSTPRATTTERPRPGRFTLALAAACGLLATAATAGEAPRATLPSAKLNWQVRRTSVERARATEAALAASAGAQAPRTLRHPEAKAIRQPSRVSPGGVRQISNQDQSTLPDPFEEEPIPGNPNPADLQAVGQPAEVEQAPLSIEAAPPPAAAEPAPTALEPAPGSLEPAPDSLAPPAEATPPGPDVDLPAQLPVEEPARQDAPPSMQDELGPIVEGTEAPRGRMSCEDYQGECEKQVEELRRRDIQSIIFGIVVENDEGQEAIEGRDYPCECKLLGDRVFEQRNFACTTFTWKASSLCHKPLYFEDVALERYGHSWNPVVQPFVSAAHFFVSVPLLPYKMGLHPPHECIYTLGYYRPGSCAPYMIEPIPLSVRAGVFEALGATAFGFWFWPPPTGP